MVLSSVRGSPFRFASVLSIGAASSVPFLKRFRQRTFTSSTENFSDLKTFLIFEKDPKRIELDGMSGVKSL